jgi:hypothetical protein
MSAQGDAGRAPPRPDYRRGRRLFLIGVLVAVVSLLLLAVTRGSADGSGNSAAPIPTASSGSPGGGDYGPAPGGGNGGPPAGEPPDSLPGETADEYRWRAEAADLRQQARDALQAALDAADPADAALHAQLEHVVALLDHEAEAEALRQKARASAASSTAPGIAPDSSGGGAGGLTTVVGLVGALGGMITAAAGLFTAWVAWRKAARG